MNADLLRSFWLFALYVSDMGAVAIGLVWILGRILYFVGAVAAKQANGFKTCAGLRYRLSRSP
jgi:hypothetical protein